MTDKTLERVVRAELAKGKAKFGRVSLDVQKDLTPFIPHLMGYQDHDGILETMAFAVAGDMPVLLVGETGVGKTAAVRHIAARTRNSLRRVNVNGSTTAEDFVGQLMVNEKGTHWVDGVLTEAMRNGYWLVIDEINAASAEVLFVLHSLLDDDRYIVLTGKEDREIVKAHPNFRVFATMNPPERYAGTKDMNKAMLSRFAVTIEVPLPPSSIELGSIAGKSKFLTAKGTEQLKNFLSEVRGAYNKEELEVFISPRDVRSIVSMLEHTGSMSTALARTVLPRGTKSEQKAITALARLHFTSPKEGAEAKPVKKDFVLGAKVVILKGSKFEGDNGGGIRVDGETPSNGREGSIVGIVDGTAFVKSVELGHSPTVLGYKTEHLKLL